MAQDTTIDTQDREVEAFEWEVESPFLADAPAPRGSANIPATSIGRSSSPSYELESPFVSEYVGQEDAPGPHAELFASLVGELYDQEFEEALEDLANEATAVAEEQLSFEYEDPGQQRLEMEHALRQYLQPLEQATEAMLDRLTVGIGDKDISQLSESELETVLNQFSPTESGLTPTFENFLGGVFKKVKKVVQAAKKVGGKIGKFLPHSIILNKLKGLVRPLLERVLRTAIDKLPVAIRPVAKELAKRFLGIAPTTEMEEPAERLEAASADSAQVQQELDAQLAGYIVEGEAFEREVGIQQAVADQGAPIGDPIRELERSRSDFARQVIHLQDGEDPRPLVENFVPAILAALKLGISVVGRPRVVQFMAKLLAQLISRYVGQQQAMALSSALVDAGLRLVSLEASEGSEPITAGYTLASTVEDTVNRLVQTTPESAWGSETLLEGYIREAFEHAAAAHFPDPLIRQELHEAAQASGAWVALPGGTSSKRYKKYSQIINVTIAPQTAAAVNTFGGVSLRDFLKNQLGLPVDKSIRAKAHIYEAIPGTWLSLIALHEKKVPGLGSARREAWSLIHPLTPEVSGLLFNEPGLGRPVEQQFLVRRGKIAVGQRFYYLEIPGARVQMAPRGPRKPPRPARSSQTSVALDFPKRQLRVFLYYSEADAQQLAGQLRKRLPLSALLTTLRARLDISLPKILSGEPTSSVRVIHQEAPTEQFAAPLIGGALRVVGKMLAQSMVKWVLEALKREVEARYDRFVADFEQAVKKEADGVTVLIIFQAPTLLERLHNLFKLGTGVLGITGIAFQGDFKLEIHPGFVFS